MPAAAAPPTRPTAGATTDHRADGPADRARRTARRRAARREELLESAMAVVRQRGAAASMEEIAAGCGVTKPVVYKHFGDRDGLIQAMAIRFATELVLDLSAHIRSAAPLRDRLTGSVSAFVDHIARDRELYRFLSLQAPAGADQFVAGLVAEEVAGALGDLLRDAGLDSSGAEIWGYGLVGMVHVAGDWWAHHPDLPREALVEHLVTMIWSGLSGLGLDDPNRATRRRSPTGPSPDPLSTDP